MTYLQSSSIYNWDFAATEKQYTGKNVTPKIVLETNADKQQRKNQLESFLLKRKLRKIVLLQLSIHDIRHLLMAPVSAQVNI